MRELGLDECEIMSGHIEPWGSHATGWWVQSRRAPGFQQMRDEARRWRLSVPFEYGSFRSSLDEVKRCLEYCRQALA
jgi:hypothetical protein